MTDQRQPKEQTFRYLDNVPVITFGTSGRDFRIEYLNRKAELLLGQESVPALGRALGQRLPEFFSNDLLSEIYDTCCTRKRTHVAKEKKVMRLKEGEMQIGWFNLTCDPILNKTDQVTGILLFLTDITEQVIEKKSHGSRDQYLNNFFRHAPVGIVCYRGEEFIVDVANEKALEMWGKTLEEVQGKRIDEIFPEVITDPEIRKRHAISLEKLRQGQTHVVNDVELTFYRNGRAHSGWYSYIHEPYTDNHGNLMGMIAIAIEVTDQVLSRKKLQLITDALPSLVSYINSHEQYEFVNKAYEVWFGHPASDVVGRSIKDVVGPVAYDKVKGHISNALKGKADFFESWLDYRDGGKRYISAAYVPDVDDQDNVRGYIGLINDLTDRKIQEEKLRHHEDRLGLIVEGLGIGTFEYDFDSGELTCSDELKALLGLAADLPISPDVARSLVHPDDLPDLLRRLNDLKSLKGNVLAVDYRVIRTDIDKIQWMHSRIAVVESDDHGPRKPARVIGLLIDITERKLTEQKLLEFNRDLEKKVKERTAELTDANNLLLKQNEELVHTQSVLQQLIDSSVEYIAVIDTDLKFLAINKAFEKFVGKTRDMLIGKEIYDAYGGARGTKQVELLQRAFAGEVVRIKTNPAISKPDVWFDTYFIPLVFNEKVEGVIALSRDITEIVKSEQQLTTLNRQLAEAQRLARLGSWEWDIATGTVIWSDEMYNIYGYSERFAVDFVKATERMSPEDAEQSSKRTQQHIQNALDNFKKTGELVYHIPVIEFPIVLPGGDKKLLRNTGKIQLTHDGKLHRVLGAVQDVTDIRSTEQKLQLAIQELEETNKELESFNYVASHDLQEPLRKIQFYIDRVRDKTVGEDERSECLQRIDDASLRMSALIRSMLTLGRSTQREDMVPVDLNRVLETCKADLDLQIRDKKATVKWDRLPVILGSEFQLLQMFGNLMGNSLKFSDKPPVIGITVRKVTGAGLSPALGATDPFWCITFSDNGIGFDPRYKDQIFGLFKRLHLNQEYSGTGIGLSIVKRIVERHHGFIDVTSTPGEGTAFTIWLPAGRV